ncbi:MAG TPA: ThuA domain-containing protein [Capsulimonadaceae bacterium]|jgi:type 1 glutamine amidotransferase
MKRALFVGGCSAPYHRLEGAEGPVTQALQAAGFTVDVTGVRHPDGGDDFVGDYSALNSDTLSGYDVLVVHTTGTETRGGSVDAVLEFVRSGKALVGIHCATDSFTDNPEYVAAIGGKFRTHPPGLVPMRVDIVDSAHPIMAGIEPFDIADELYLFNDYDPSRVHLLAETNSFAGEANVPIAWTRDEGQGRIFYLSLGHDPGAMASEPFQKLLGQGANWAIRA